VESLLSIPTMTRLLLLAVSGQREEAAAAAILIESFPISRG